MPSFRCREALPDELPRVAVAQRSRVATFSQVRAPRFGEPSSRCSAPGSIAASRIVAHTYTFSELFPVFSAGLHCGMSAGMSSGPVQQLFPVFSAGLHCGSLKVLA